MRTRAHGAMLAGAFLRAGAALAGLVVVVSIVGRDGIASEGEWLALAAAGVVAVAALGRLAAADVGVGPDGARGHRGAARRRAWRDLTAASRPSRSPRVDGLKVRQTWPGRLLGYGTIQLSCGRRRNGLAFVPRPERVRAVIAEQVDRRRAETVATTASVVHRRVAA